jgi:uncharacterized membrane protein
MKTLYTLILVLFLAFPFSMFSLWGQYLAVTALMRARDAGSLTKPAEFIGKIVLAIGYLSDFLVNVLVCTVLFLELPREWVVTARVSRHKKTSTGYRQALAAWVCVNLLDPFDPSGCHCK